MIILLELEDLSWIDDDDDDDGDMGGFLGWNFVYGLSFFFFFVIFKDG